MTIIDRLFVQREMSEEKKRRAKPLRGCRRVLAKFGAGGGTLAFVFSLISVILPPTTYAAFPGANGKIAFKSDRDGNDEIYVMNADGTGQTRLTNTPANDDGPA